MRHVQFKKDLVALIMTRCLESNFILSCMICAPPPPPSLKHENISLTIYSAQTELFPHLQLQIHRRHGATKVILVVELFYPGVVYHVRTDRRTDDPITTCRCPWRNFQAGAYKSVTFSLSFGTNKIIIHYNCTCHIFHS